MKTHDAWPAHSFDALSRDEIDTADRARKQWEETEAWHLPHMARSLGVIACTRDCDQGRKCKCAPSPAECCTEVGADGVESVWESADSEVIPAFIGAFIALLAFAALIGMLQP